MFTWLARTCKRTKEMLTADQRACCRCSICENGCARFQSPKRSQSFSPEISTLSWEPRYTSSPTTPFALYKINFQSVEFADSYKSSGCRCRFYCRLSFHDTGSSAWVVGYEKFFISIMICHFYCSILHVNAKRSFWKKKHQQWKSGIFSNIGFYLKIEV